MAFNKGKVLANAQKYVLQGKYELAIEEYKKIIQENPKDWNTVIQIGNLYLKIGKNREAINNLKKVADYYFQDGQHVKAIALYKQINRTDPSMEDVSLKLADLFIKQGLNMEAKSQLVVLGEHFNKKGQAKQACEVFRRLIELEPDNIKAKIELARTYKALNDVKSAIGEYISISEEYEKQNLLQESLKTLEMGYELEPSNSIIIKKIITYYNKIGSPEKAIRLLEKQIKDGVATAEVYMQLSEAYAQQQKYEQAELILHKCIELDPFFIPAYQNLLQGLIDKNETEEARRLVDGLSLKLITKHEGDKAIPFLKRMLDEEPTDGEMAERLVEIYKELHQENNAITTLNVLMDSLLAKKDYTSACDVANKLIAIEPDNSQYQEKLKFIEGFLKPKVEAPPKEVKKVEVPKAETRKVEIPQSETRKADVPKVEAKKTETPRIVTPRPEVLKAEVVKAEVSKPVTPKGIPHEEPFRVEPPQKAIPKTEPKKKEEKIIIEPVKDEEIEIELDMPMEETPTPEVIFKEAVKVEKQIEQPAISKKETKIVEVKEPEEAAPEEPLSQFELEEKQEFVREHMIEAEVFNKYGLVEKAIDQLELIANRYPDVADPYIKLKDIYLEKNKQDKAVLQYIKLINLYRTKGEQDKVEEFLKAAKAIDPKNPELLEVSGAPVPPGDALHEFEKLEAIYTSKKTAKDVSKKAEFKALDDLELEIDITRDIEDIASIKEMMENKTEQEEVETLPPVTVEETGEIQLTEPQIVEEESFTVELEEPQAEERIQEEQITSEKQAVKAEEEVMAVAEEEKENKEMHVDETMTDNEFEIQIPEEISTTSAFDEEVATLPEKQQNEVQEEIKIEEKESAIAETEPRAFSELEDSIDVAFDGFTEEQEGVAEKEEKIEIEPAQEISIEIQVEQEKTLESEQELSSKGNIEAEEFNETVEPKELQIEEEMPQKEPVSAQKETMDFALGITEEELEHEIEESFSDSKKKDETSSTHEMKVAEIFSEVPQEESNEQAISVQNEEKEESKIIYESPEPLPFEKNPYEEQKIKEEEIEFSFKESITDESPEPAKETGREDVQQLYKNEESFFDLASELEKEMLNVQTAVEPESKPEETYLSLEEMFSEFKKGVEKQIDSQDYETRYNLGIAYKEMGLLDEAISEFQIAAKDPHKFLECCSLLGLCFIEKGLPKLAIKWYEKGLIAPGFTEEEYQSLRYDLAQTYETIGELQQAYDIYLEVYSAHATYRDVAQKLKDLESTIKKK